MSASLATESATVQNPLVGYAGEIGWGIVPQSEAVILRKGEGGMFECSRSGIPNGVLATNRPRSGIK